MRYIISTIFITLLSLLIACSASPAEPNAPASFQFTDQLGREVRLDSVPQRIISLAPSNTEIVFALGLADSLVAVTDYCDYPPEAKEKPSIGGFSTPNIEEVIALAPDLILATSIHEDRVIPQLEARGMTVLALNPETLEDVLASITLVGKVTDKKEDASELTGTMRSRMEAVTNKTATLPQVQRPRVFYLVWHDPLMTAGSGTLHDELIARAGGTNIAHDLAGWADISLEAVIQANPEVMIAGVGYGMGESLTHDFLKTEPRLRDTLARQNNRVYGIDGNVVSRPGPRIIDGLEEFARFIHPELFKETR